MMLHAGTGCADRSGRPGSGSQASSVPLAIGAVLYGRGLRFLWDEHVGRGIRVWEAACFAVGLARYGARAPVAAARVVGAALRRAHGAARTIDGRRGAIARRRPAARADVVGAPFAGPPPRWTRITRRTVSGVVWRFDLASHSWRLSSMARRSGSGTCRRCSGDAYQRRGARAAAPAAFSAPRCSSGGRSFTATRRAAERAQ